MKLRLLLTANCNRSCEGCCNKDWDLAALPVCESFAGYDEVLLTGGEPLLQPILTRNVADEVRASDKLTGARTKVLLYTALAAKVPDVLPWLDGLTLTLHESRDVRALKKLNKHLDTVPWLDELSLRLNVFVGVELGNVDLTHWQVKDGMEWVADCPLPQDEVFMKYGEV